jgi:hypothetical protein
MQGRWTFRFLDARGIWIEGGRYYRKSTAAQAARDAKQYQGARKTYLVKL